ncbi:carbon-phosphorus lyase, partial [Escherichia coli]
WQWLEGKKIDLAVLECTYGFNGENRTNNHMSLETVFAARDRLAELDCLKKTSQLVVSHISHSGGLLHDELVAACDKENILVAWDGLNLSINQ